MSEAVLDWWDRAKPQPGMQTIFCLVLGFADVVMPAVVILRATRIWGG